MTEKELQLLGFQREHMDEDDDYYYYLDIVNGLGLISCTSFEGQEKEWYVEIFNTEPSIRFTEFGEVQALINLLESRIVKK